MLKSSILTLFLVCITLQSRLLTTTYNYPVYSGMPARGIIQSLGSFHQVSSNASNLQYQFRGVNAPFIYGSNDPNFVSGTFPYIQTYYESWLRLNCDTNSQGDPQFELENIVYNVPPPNVQPDQILITESGSFVTWKSWFLQASGAQLDAWNNAGYCWIDIGEYFIVSLELEHDGWVLPMWCQFDPNTPVYINLHSAPAWCRNHNSTDSKDQPWDQPPPKP